MPGTDADTDTDTQENAPEWLGRRNAKKMMRLADVVHCVTTSVTTASSTTNCAGTYTLLAPPRFSSSLPSFHFFFAHHLSHRPLQGRRTAVPLEQTSTELKARRVSLSGCAKLTSLTNPDGETPT